MIFYLKQTKKYPVRVKKYIKQVDEDTQEVYLKATCKYRNKHIFYTEDGSTPTVNSKLYTKPIKVENNKSYRFTCMNATISFSSNNTAGRVLTTDEFFAFFSDVTGSYKQDCINGIVVDGFSTMVGYLTDTPFPWQNEQYHMAQNTGEHSIYYNGEDKTGKIGTVRQFNIRQYIESLDPSNGWQASILEALESLSDSEKDMYAICVSASNIASSAITSGTIKWITPKFTVERTL